ncbi:MAG: N-6 DNA methylase [Dissulfurispiraceae bacterium]
MNTLACYYTERQIARLLVDSIPQNEPRHILELGAGRGSLLRAAHDRWQRAKYYAAEIDSSGISILKKDFPFAKLFNINGLSHKLPQELKLSIGSVDVAICNPPYLKIENNIHLNDIFKCAGLSTCTKLPTLTSDLVFLAQNLQMLRKGGEMGIILPDSLLTGHNYVLFREALLQNHQVFKVIQLPDKIFTKTEARTHILLIRKDAEPLSRIPLYLADDAAICKKAIFVSVDNLLRRMDFTFYNLMQRNTPQKTLLTLSDIGAEIVRGSFTHKELLGTKLPFFHTSDFPELFQNGVKFRDKASGKGIIARKGDILLARVGKRCIGKVTFVKSGTCWLTDCIIRIRVGKVFRKIAFDSFASYEGQNWLSAQAHGVCAQVISKRDLFSFPLYELGNENIPSPSIKPSLCTSSKD